MTTFDDERDANIAKNREMLKALGLDVGTRTFAPSKPKPKPKAKSRAPPKRKQPASDESSGEDEDQPRKTARVEVNEENGNTGLRRSGRNAGKRVDYKGDGESIANSRPPRPCLISSAAQRGVDTEPRSVDKRIHDPKTYGAIPGVAVGTWWETRQACSIDAIHAPWVAGISSGPHGAYSVALSGGYEDDVDVGEGFTFTGAGGRDLKGTKNNPKNLRTAEQSSDQTFENSGNKALKKSVETRKPVRVIRGYKLQSEYAPAEGYRYDGLYTVEKAWQERGFSGFLVCKFAFKRIPGQDPLVVNAIESSDADDSDEQEEDS
ncbi:unnamed protein product [Somion occarium]|uniref:YDG domain-containing protein n=1 Tax=Somion occarium TaxID=3059160 RepID=A0ABP1CMJ0_9APHY